MRNILVIFDMNGTVVDTEEAHWQAYHEVLATEGIDFTLAEFSSEWTTQGKKLEDTLVKHGRDDLLPRAKELKTKKDEVFRQTMEERVRIMPGIHDLLERLKGEVHLALDSTSAAKDIEIMLEHFGIAHVFELTTSGDMEWNEEKYGKSTKASRFVFISDSLEIKPSNSVVVGDAEKDIKAAREAGMRIIIIPNIYTRENDFSDADVKVDSASEMSTEMIGELCRQEEQLTEGGTKKLS